MIDSKTFIDTNDLMKTHICEGKERCELCGKSIKKDYWTSTEKKLRNIYDRTGHPQDYAKLKQFLSDKAQHEKEQNSLNKTIIFLVLFHLLWVVKG